MSSTQANVPAADLKDLDRGIGRTNRLMARGLCSTMLLSGMISDDAIGILGETACRLYPG
jgi:hypothetical protein